MNKNLRNGQDHATGAHPSTGIGEAISRGILVAHGGDHPGTKTKSAKDALKESRKRQRKARKRAR